MFPRLLVLLLTVSLVVGVVARPSGGAGKPVRNVVKPTDTLWPLATAHYSGDPLQGVWELQLRNHLPRTTIVAGPRLVLQQLLETGERQDRGVHLLSPGE